MKEDQIKEVMGLVRQYGDKNYLQGGADAQDRELSSKKLDDEIRGKVLAIETKLRELLRNHEANKEALDEYFKKTDWVNGTFQSHELGHHRADVLRMRIEKLQKQVQK